MSDLTWLLTRITPLTLLDLAAVTFIFYWLLSVIRGTRATLLIRGVVILWLFVALVGAIFQLSTLTWIIRNSGVALLVTIPIIFQPELRRALETLGRTGAGWTRRRRGGDTASVLDAVAEAATQLMRLQMGALIVLERQTGLQEYADRGIPVDAEVSSQLIVTMFYHNSPLHDGAIIVRDGRVLAASVVLPLTDQLLGPQQFGTRHRAALGISEHSDAVAVVVSEEHGSIGVAANSRLVSNIPPERLPGILAGLFEVKPAAA